MDLSDFLPQPREQNATELRTWLLVPSMLLGSETWAGVANVLNGLGQNSVIAAPRTACASESDHIGPWLESVLSVMPVSKAAPVVVAAHGASCPRLPLVADRLMDLGYNVQSIILVNGRFPVDNEIPTEADTHITSLLDGLTRPDGYLPPWHRWWGSFIESMLPDEEQRDRVFSQAKPVPRVMFDQPVPVPKLPGDIGLAFLALGDYYVPDMDEAKTEGWAVARIDGEHLMLVVDPMLTACMLMSLAAKSQNDS